MLQTTKDFPLKISPCHGTSFISLPHPNRRAPAFIAYRSARTRPSLASEFGSEVEAFPVPGGLPPPEARAGRPSRFAPCGSDLSSSLVTPPSHRPSGQAVGSAYPHDRRRAAGGPRAVPLSQSDLGGPPSTTTKRGTGPEPYGLGS